MMIFGFLFMLALIALPIVLVVILLNKTSNKQAKLPMSNALYDADHP
jgi:regulatory protein YycI of two-component signal transduction system YycFG